MKSGIHPDYMKTKVTCTGCGTSFETMSTVPELSVEICSNCHPFYTGKQKLVDTAGRVDRFREQSQKAAAKRASLAERNAKKAVRRAEAEASAEPLDEEMKQVDAKVEAHTESTANDIGSVPDSGGKAAKNSAAADKL